MILQNISCSGIDYFIKGTLLYQIPNLRIVANPRAVFYRNSHRRCSVRKDVLFKIQRKTPVPESLF